MLMSSVLNVLSGTSPPSCLYSTYAHLPLSALFISIACYLKLKVNNLEPEGTRPRTDPSTTGFKKSSFKCLILAKLSQFGAAWVPKELQPER